MKILILGGGGFIGNKLLATISNKYTFSIVNVCRQKINLEKKNVESFVVNRKDLPRMNRCLGHRKFDVVVDLCAFSAKDIKETLAIVSTQNYILLSSCAVYDATLIGEIDESTPVAPSTWHEYGSNKLQAEQELKKFTGNSIVIRPTVVYGIGDSNLSRAKFLFEKVAIDTNIVIPGNAKFRNSYIYVDDLIELIDTSLFFNKSVILNVGGKIFDWYEYLEILSTIMQKNVTIQNQNLSLDEFRNIARKQNIIFPHNVFSDFIVTNRLAQQTLNWSPRVELKDGLRFIWDWLKGKL